jgi:hypothetical protein
MRKRRCGAHHRLCPIGPSRWDRAYSSLMSARRRRRGGRAPHLPCGGPASPTTLEDRYVAQGIPDVDSIPNFGGKYHADGFDLTGAPNKQWVYNIVGNLPQHGGTITIRAPIVPVSVDLLAADGTVRFHLDATQYAQRALNSPIFQNAPYSSSSTPTQFTDAIQRAEFAKSAKSDWHTLLQPVLEPGVTIQLPHGSYGYAVWNSRPYAGQIAFIVVDDATLTNLLYPSSYSRPPDPSSVMGALEASGEITPQDITNPIAPPVIGRGPGVLVYIRGTWVGPGAG